MTDATAASVSRNTDDAFLRRIAASGKKWIVVVDQAGEPRRVFSALHFVSGALFGAEFNPLEFCHHPLIVRDPDVPLGRMLACLTVEPEKLGDDVIDVDVMLVWTDTQRRIITGSDILGRLLRRIAGV